MFRILRYFSIASFVAIVFVTIGLLGYYRQIAVIELIEMGESRNVAVTQVFANSIWPRFASYVATANKLDGDALRKRPETAEMHKAVTALMQGLPIQNVKIYSLDRKTIFSTKPEQMGEVKHNEDRNDGLYRSAIDGEVASHLTQQGTLSAFEGNLDERDILESYLPIRNADGTIAAVIELYADVTPLIERIGHVQTNLLIGLVMAFGLLYGVLFMIVRHGDRILKTQYADLKRNEQHMKEKNIELNQGIEERKRVEEALRTAKLDAERANRTRSKFFAAASHDLRQPLHAVALYLPVLARRVTNDKAQEVIDAIKSSYEAMGNLLDALLDFSKLDAGVVTPDISPIPAAALFDKLMVEFAPQAAERNIELRVMPLDAYVLSDPTLLEATLRNYLSNAIRYTSGGKILLAGRQRGRNLRFEVWDTGTGIPDDKIDEIFQEFCQLDNPERDRDQGLGLGLAIVARLSSLLGHQIDVKSQLGKGSMFAIEVPFCEAPRQAGDIFIPCRPGAGLLEGAVVVLIDDEAEIVRGTRLLLEDWGCEVITAETIDEAIAKVAEQGGMPDVILADLRLRKNTTGIMAVESIRNFLGVHVPAVIVTGDTDPRWLRQVNELGLPLLRKPVQPEDLRDALELEMRAAQERDEEPDTARASLA